MEALAKAGKMAATGGNVRLALGRAGFKGVDQTSLDLAMQSIAALRNASTDYFEAKPPRVVKLNEFKGAVVLKGTSPEIMAVLQKNGMVVEVHGKAEGARSAAILKLANKLDKAHGDIRFSRSQAKEVRGPDTPYTGNYETDLFGNPLPANKRAAASPTRPAGVRGNAQSSAALPADTPIPAGEYLVNTHVATEASRLIGTGTVNSPQQAATATAYLYRSAVERFDGIVTDKAGKVLAVIGGFKGALSQASVYPATLMAEAVRIPGAAKVWFSHNHPSGKATLSAADQKLNLSLGEVFRGSGIESMGTMAVAGDRFEHVTYSEFGNGTPNGGAIPVGQSPVKVPVYERELSPVKQQGDRIDSPALAKSIGKRYFDKAGKSGILLLNAQNEVAAWVPVTDAMKAPLRGGALNAIYRAISQSNASAAIIVHGGELDASGNFPAGVSASENIAAALAAIDVRPLDSLNAKTGRSAAEQGRDIARGPVFSRKSSIIPVEPFTDKAKGMIAAKKEDARLVQAENGGWLMAPKPQPYNAQETRDAQAKIDALNIALKRVGMSPAAVLRDAPSQSMSIGRSVARTLGYNVTFIKPNTGFDGVSLAGESFVSPSTKHPEVALIGHEVLHAFKRMEPALYESLAEQLRPYLKQGVVDAKRQWEDANGGKDTTTALAEEEVFADLNGAMWMDPKFWAEMRQNDPSLFRAVAYKFMEVATKAMSGMSRFKADQMVNDVDAVRSIIAKEWALQAQEMANPSEFTEGDVAFSRSSSQTDTPAFRKWFGGSKVVNSDGSPMVVYHGGLHWNVADMGAAGREAMWMTPEMSVASGYADQYTKNDKREMKPLYVRMENPLDLRQDDVVDKVFGEDDAPTETQLSRDRSLVSRPFNMPD